MDKPNAENPMDLVIDFSLGLLTDEQEDVLLAAARQNPALEAMLQQQCASCERNRATAVPDFDQSQAFEKQVIRVSAWRRTQNWAWTGALAASIALVIWLFPATEPDLYWLPMEETMSLQRSGAVGADEFQAGVALYAAGELDQAIEKLAQAEVQGGVLDLRNLYLASALINSGNFIDARIVLSDIDLDVLPAPWRGYGRELSRLCADQPLE